MNKRANANGLRSNVNQKGRSETTRFNRLDRSLQTSPGWLAASPNARALYVELSMMHNGGNNGLISLSIRDAADRMGVVDTHAAVAAFTELVKVGLIAETRPAFFSTKAGEASHARRWRLTAEAIKNTCGPTNEFLAYDPPAQSRERRRMIAGQAALKRWHRKIAGVQSTTQTPNCDGDSTTLHTDEPAGLVNNDGDSTTAIPPSLTNCENEPCSGLHHIYSYPATPTERVTPSLCSRLRKDVSMWGARFGAGAQRQLARMTGMSESKLSRFLSDSHGRRSLTIHQFEALQAAIADQPKSEQPRPTLKLRAATK